MVKEENEEHDDTQTVGTSPAIYPNPHHGNTFGPKALEGGASVTTHNTDSSITAVFEEASKQIRLVTRNLHTGPRGTRVRRLGVLDSPA